MSPTIRSLVIPVSDLDAAKAVYTALLGAPHTSPTTSGTTWKVSKSA
jgi:extradiol dioxygenase family protein